MPDRAQRSTPPDTDNIEIASDIGPFAIVPVSLLRDPTVTFRSLRVWCALASYADRDSGEAFPSQRTIAARLGTSRATVDRGLAELRDGGWITISPRLRDGRKVGTRYVVRYTGRVRTDASAIVTDASPTDASDASPGDASYEQTTEQTKRETSRDSLDPLFLAWYSEYPRKIGRADAVRAWRSAVKTATVEDLTVARDHYATSRRSEDPKFTMHPSTFLRSDRWRDWLTRPAGVRTVEEQEAPSRHGRLVETAVSCRPWSDDLPPPPIPVVDGKGQIFDEAAAEVASLRGDDDR